MRRGSQSVAAYIETFRKLRNKADVGGFTQDVQVAWFIQGLEPESLRRAVNTNGPKTLQDAFDSATRLAPDHRNSFADRPQNPTRVQC